LKGDFLEILIVTQLVIRFAMFEITWWFITCSNAPAIGARLNHMNPVHTFELLSRKSTNCCELYRYSRLNNEEVTQEV
jgi:hypothetical protein